MASKEKKTDELKQVKIIEHKEAKRAHIPTAEYEAMMGNQEMIKVAYQRNRDLDPQLVWRGKDEQDWSDLVVPAPPIYIQEKVHPKVLIDELMRESAERAETQNPAPQQLDWFANFTQVPAGAEASFYEHEANWTNRMILGDSLQVMASLAEREGLRGKVQCIYIDPPYGIKFNSNFQWSTTSRDVKDGKLDHLTREPEQVKAFRDTWRDGIHSYLTYLRDRLTVARDLLTDSGSIFMQIGDENVHRVRAIMDEVFGDNNFASEIIVTKTGSQTSNLLGNVADIILWYVKDTLKAKYRPIYVDREQREEEQYSADPILSSGNSTGESIPFEFQNKVFHSSSNNHWKTHLIGMNRLSYADRITKLRNSIRYKRYFQDYPVKAISNIWSDLGGATSMIYVVQSSSRLIQRCVLMTTDPGDLVLDPTCGSGTTAYVAEQWGRRWITVDTSRVALALARMRIMGARYPFYLLADSKAGQKKEGALTGKSPSTTSTYNNIRHGFVYERVPHIMLKSIANNAEIDVIWEDYQTRLEPLRQELNSALGKTWEEWEIPRDADETWSEATTVAHQQWWEQRIARQQKIDQSIAQKADIEYLYDKPYEDNKKVRVAGPFTVESLSPHRILAVDDDDDVLQGSYGNGTQFIAEAKGKYGAEEDDFVTVILDNLRTAGVQQAHKENKINFTSLVLWPGQYICAEGRYLEGETGKERRAGIFIGPEFGTVQRSDLVRAARECGDAGFDLLIACGFNYDAHSTEFEKLGQIPMLKARMNADLHMANDLKNTGAGNLFVIFGEPDIDILPTSKGQIQVKINGVDVFHPQSGLVVSSSAKEIACWFIDTDYNEESFFVRHAYFLGANDPYQALKTTLKAEVDEEAWESLNRDISRPFDKPKNGAIAVKVINHLGDEVMKVCRI
jgi:adenine-specific DNA-methyltransferase